MTLRLKSMTSRTEYASNGSRLRFFLHMFYMLLSNLHLQKLKEAQRRGRSASSFALKKYKHPMTESWPMTDRKTQLGHHPPSFCSVNRGFCVVNLSVPISGIQTTNRRSDRCVFTHPCFSLYEKTSHHPRRRDSAKRWRETFPRNAEQQWTKEIGSLGAPLDGRHHYFCIVLKLLRVWRGSWHWKSLLDKPFMDGSCPRPSVASQTGYHSAQAHLHKNAWNTWTSPDKVWRYEW